MCAAWIGFLGSILGGLLTLLGVWLTIFCYKKKEDQQAQLEKKKNIALLYWNLKKNMEVVRAIYERINENKPFGIIKSYHDYDYQFYFNKIIYVQDILDSEEITTIILFYHALAEIEEKRSKDIITENQELIIKLIKTMNGEKIIGKGMDVVSILDKLKPYVVGMKNISTIP